MIAHLPTAFSRVYGARNTPYHGNYRGDKGNGRLGRGEGESQIAVVSFNYE